jgi:hypothetical protein
MKIMNYLKGDGKKDLRAQKVTQKIPRIQDIKWNTWAIACDFIRAHTAAVLGVLACAPKQLRLHWCSDYETIGSVLHQLRVFVEATEGDHVTLPKMFANYLRFRDELDRMKDNPFAKRFQMYADGRFHTTGDIVMAELAYIFTAEGFLWMKDRRQIFQLSGNEEEKITLIDEITGLASKLEDVCCLTKRLRVTVRKERGVITHQNPSGLHMQFWLDAYLDSEGPSGERLLSAWWQEFAVGRTPPTIAELSTEQKKARERFAETAISLTEMPATEAACERAISVLGHLFPSSRSRSGDDLINAQMMIRMYYQFHPNEDKLEYHQGHQSSGNTSA